MKSNTYTPELRNIMMKFYSSAKTGSKPRNSNELAINTCILIIFIVIWMIYRILLEESKRAILE